MRLGIVDMVVFEKKEYVKNGRSFYERPNLFVKHDNDLTNDRKSALYIRRIFDRKDYLCVQI